MRRYSYESASSAVPSGRAVAESPLVRLLIVLEIEAGGLVTELADKVGESGPPPIVLMDAIDVLDGLERVRPDDEACDIVEK